MKALLIDLDGVIYVQEKLIPGAVDTIQLIRQRNIPHLFVTNTTSHSRAQLVARLNQVGVPVNEASVFTAPAAAARFLRGQTDPRCYFYLSENIIPEFNGINRVESKPTHVVIGDVGEMFSYEMMNKVFGMIMEGAEIIALQKNRFWITKEGLKLDAGAFIAALEYATGKTARVFGKPSKEFFHQACATLGFVPSDVTMIGDDLKADIEGAAKAGLKTIFVKTGKDKHTLLEGMSPRPDVVLDSIKSLTNLM